MSSDEGFAVRKALGLGPDADGADVLAEIGWLQEAAREAPPVSPLGLAYCSACGEDDGHAPGCLGQDGVL